MIADKDIQFLKSPVTKKEAIKIAIQYGGLGSSLKEQGFWDASTNTPELQDGIGTIGYYYIVSVGGTVDFGNGNITFTVGDWVYYNTSNEWVKFETGVDYVPVNKAGDTMTGNLQFGTGTGLKASNAGGFILSSSNDDIVMTIGASGSGTLSFNQLTTNGLLQVSGGAVSSRANNNIVTEATTARTLTLSDAYKYIRTTNASATAITIPPNADVAFEVGTQIDFSQQGAGVLSFVAGSGVTINTTSLTMSARYAAATAVKVDTNEWDLIIG